MSATVHKDAYSNKNLETRIIEYDKSRNAKNPYKNQRQTDVFGTSDSYGWSTDKARQTANTERTSFTNHIRKHGFKF